MLVYCMHVSLCVFTSRILALKNKETNTEHPCLRKLKCENINTYLDLGVKSTLHRYAIIYFCGIAVGCLVHIQAFEWSEMRYGAHF